MSKLAELEYRLRKVASLEWDRAAALEAASYLRGRVRAALARHVDTGYALRTARVVATGQTIKIHLAPYVRFIADVPYGRGIPRADVAHIRAIRKAKLAAAIKGGA